MYVANVLFGHKFPLKTLIPLTVCAVGSRYLLFFCCEVLVGRARSGPQAVLTESKMPCLVGERSGSLVMTYSVSCTDDL